LTFLRSLRQKEFLSFIFLSAFTLFLYQNCDGSKQNGAPQSSSTIETTEEISRNVEAITASLSDCPLGGITLITYLDQNKDGQRDESESAESYTNICSSLQKEENEGAEVAETASETCPNGGVTVYTFSDKNSDGHFDSSEKLNSIHIVCNSSTISNISYFSVKDAGSETCQHGGLLFNTATGTNTAVTTFICDSQKKSTLDEKLADKSRCPNGGNIQFLSPNESSLPFYSLKCSNNAWAVLSGHLGQELSSKMDSACHHFYLYLPSSELSEVSWLILINSLDFGKSRLTSLKNKIFRNNVRDFPLTDSQNEQINYCTFSFDPNSLTLNYKTENGAEEFIGDEGSIHLLFCANQSPEIKTCSPSDYICPAGHFMKDKICEKMACKINQTQECRENNGVGIQTCLLDGTGYGACKIQTCDSAYILKNGNCAPQICQTGETRYCLKDHQIGQQACTEDKTSYQDCVVLAPIQCEEKYYLENGQCLPQICTPNSTAECSEGNGSGTKTCHQLGSTYLGCVLNVCTSGFVLKDNTCLPQICQPSEIKTCLQDHRYGQQSCDSLGISYSNCELGKTCESGNYFNDQSCVPQVCSPNEVIACTSKHVMGTKGCNANGSAFEACVLQEGTCETGYTYQNGSCTRAVQNSNKSWYVLSGTTLSLSISENDDGLSVQEGKVNQSLSMSTSSTLSGLSFSENNKLLTITATSNTHGKWSIPLRVKSRGEDVDLSIEINIMTPFTWTGKKSNTLDKDAGGNFCGTVSNDHSSCLGFSALNYSSNVTYTLKSGYPLYGNVLNDNVYFPFILDNTCTQNCTVDLKTNFYTRGLILSYGQFNQNQYNITYSGTGINLSNGSIFNGGSGSLSVPTSCSSEALGISKPYYDFTCENATFNAPTMFRAGGNFAATSCQFNSSPAGTLRFVSNTDTSSSCSNWLKKSIIKFPKNMNVFNLEFSGDTPTYDLSGGQISVLGNLLLEDRNWHPLNRGTMLNGTINLKGNMQLLNVRAFGNLKIIVDGESDQLISCPIVSLTHGFDYNGRPINDYYCLIPQLEINKSSGKVTAINYLRIQNYFNYIQGETDFTKAIGMFGELFTGYNNFQILPLFNKGPVIFKQLYDNKNRPPASIWY